jgi:hypothetical protein
MARIGWIGMVIALALLVGCEKKKLPQEPPPTNTNPTPKKDTPKVSAPATVPQGLVDEFNRYWPEIEKLGASFEAKFKEADKLRAAGELDQLDKVIEAANDDFIKLSDIWAKVTYSDAIDEDNEAQAAACRRFLSPYEKRIKGWRAKHKGLKEISRAK